MNRFCACAFALFCTLPLTAGAEPVRIVVQKVLVASGNIAIAIFNSPASWDKQVPDESLWITPAVLNESSMTAELPPGDYGFFLYQDVDSNGQLKQSAIGFPKEPYAFSNDVKIFLSKPSFNSMKFHVAAGGQTVHTVQLRQP